MVTLHRGQRVNAAAARLSTAWLQRRREAAAAAAAAMVKRTTTLKGAEMLSRRLLRGPIAYFVHCIGQLQRRGIVHQAPMTAAGNREHYSLLLNGKLVEEEMAGNVMQKPVVLDHDYP